MKLLHLIPPPLHRLGYRVAHKARRAWLRRRGSITHGCTVVAHDGAGNFLLVRHSYGRDVWTFPSGGIRRDETPIVAALREFREELGCGLIDARRLATFKESYAGATNVVHVFSGIADGVPRPDRREIVEASFFARDRLPEPLSGKVASRLAAFDAAAEEAPAWHKLQQR